MSSTLEFEATRAATAVANRKSQQAATGAASRARAAVEATEDRNVWDPYLHAAIQDRADAAYDRQYETTYSETWQRAYDQALPEEYQRLAPSHQSDNRELTPRGTRKF